MNISVMKCNLYTYLAPYEYNILHIRPGLHCCCVEWASATIAAAWLRLRWIVSFSLKGVNHRAYLAIWSVLLFVLQLCHCFQTTDVSTIPGSFKTNNRCIHLFWRWQYRPRNKSWRNSCGSQAHNLPNRWAKVDKD